MHAHCHLVSTFLCVSVFICVLYTCVYNCRQVWHFEGQYRRCVQYERAGVGAHCRGAGDAGGWTHCSRWHERFQPSTARQVLVALLRSPHCGSRTGQYTHRYNANRKASFPIAVNAALLNIFSVLLFPLSTN